MNILLVEDNPADMRLVKEAMSECAAAATLHWVPDGDTALDYLHRRGAHAQSPVPDLVLLDLNLPGMSGKEILAEIKQDPALRSIPVIVLTSSAARQDVLDTYAAHGNAYMVKPVDFDAYVSLVERIHTYWLGAVLLPSRAA